MCGIVGYSGAQNAPDIIFSGLASLEYRGYDSAGIALADGEGICTIKAKGRLSELVAAYEQNGSPKSHSGIGHTRWATHGQPSQKNAHPHGTKKLALVHNGIIENYLPLKNMLLQKGCEFASETDSEVIAHLLSDCYNGDAIAAIHALTDQLQGSYALAILFADKPGVVYALRKESPLVVGLGHGQNFVASDVTAILPYTRRYHLLSEGEIAIVEADGVQIVDGNGNALAQTVLTAGWDVVQAQKDGYPHFMLKEIFEQPTALANTLCPRIVNGLPDFSADGLPADFFSDIEHVTFVGCGTALHAGTVGKMLTQQLARIPAEADYASEFRYRRPILTPKTLVVVISQSGETADTLAALRLAKLSGARCLAVVNVAGSSIAREADATIHTHAGPEIAVASTKAYSVQLGILYLLSFALAAAKGSKTNEQICQLTAQLLTAANETKAVLAQSEEINQLAGHFTNAQTLFYIGRGLDYALAMEGSLKLKEISYIHSEAYPAGELKHGTISLITPGVPVVGLATQQHLLPKTISNIKEARARGGYTLLVAKEGAAIDPDVYDHIVSLPPVDDLFLPLPGVVALQLFAYHIAVARGCDVDKPRNLAKSVTVE